MRDLGGLDFFGNTRHIEEHNQDMVSELEAARREGQEFPCLGGGQGNKSEVREYEWMGAAMFIDMCGVCSMDQADQAAYVMRRDASERMPACCEW